MPTPMESTVSRPRLLEAAPDHPMANQAAVEADQDYITQCRAQGIYPLAYPHNYHFLSRTASLEGRSAVALDAANR
jgi:hypothetical protein